jgi:hypothetical protein
VKVPRFRIAWLMVAVAIAALDFAAIGAILGSGADDFGIFLLLGALPMANVLAVGILIGQRRSGSSLFLLGFEVFGAMALALYIALLSCCRRELVIPYLSSLIRVLEQSVGRNRPFVFLPVLFFGSAVMLGLPQVAFALIGAFLCRRFKSTIARR